MTKDEAVILLCEHFSEGMVRTIVDAIAKDEALQLALEALTDFDYDKRIKAIEIIKEALETKDEPVAWMNRHGACKTSLFMEVEAGAKEEYTIPVYTQPQRTWVGLTELDCVGWFGYDTGLRLWFEADKNDDGAIPLYKDQQQRTWVGLTDEEIQECLQGLPTQTIDVYARRIEAKLKDKNNG